MSSCRPQELLVGSYIFEKRVLPCRRLLDYEDMDWSKLASSKIPMKISVIAVIIILLSLFLSATSFYLT